MQVRIVSKQALPPDMKLAVIAPGHARHSAEERAAIDTSTMDGHDGGDSVYRAATALGATARHLRRAPEPTTPPPSPPRRSPPSR